MTKLVLAVSCCASASPHPSPSLLQRRSLNLLSAMLTPKANRRRPVSIEAAEGREIEFERELPTMNLAERGPSLDGTLYWKRPLNAVRDGFRASRSSENRSSAGADPENVVVEQVRLRFRLRFRIRGSDCSTKGFACASRDIA